jgi:hypothetical protein
MRKLLSVLSLVLLYCTIAFGQPAVYVSLIASEQTVQPMSVGLDLTAENCLDLDLGEAEAPPYPPPGGFGIKFDLDPYGCPALTVFHDYRNAPVFPFTGTVQHTMIWQRSASGTSISIQYVLPTGAAMRITDVIGGVVLNLGPFTNSGTAVIPGTYPFSNAYVVMEYTNVGPATAAPIFAIAPASLNFGNVYLTASKLLTATVSNPGTDPLVITNITSSNSQFTFAPNPPHTFPITIAAGSGTYNFDVTFAPTSAGLKTANLTFFHNGPGPSTLYAVQGTGSVEIIDPPIVPNGGNFGSIGVGNTSSIIVTVPNTDDAPITVGASIIEAIGFTVTPASRVIDPFAIGEFTVTFAPTAPGPYLNHLIITPPVGSLVDIPLSGTAFATSGLIFAKDTVYRLENDFYMDVMQLKALQGGDLHSMQFRLQTNKELTDNVILTFQSITKGADINSPNWILETNVIRGPITANGASKDEIFVLLYHLTGAALPPGDYNDLFHVTYRVAQLQGIQDSIKSTFKITNAEASTIQGFPLNITPNPTALLTVIALKRGGNYGDVNGDGCVDILDLIMVVDHIVSRDSLSGAEFARADVAPWVPGNGAPNPDGFVNVQDLSVIQNIILTGLYPDGTPVGPCGYDALPKFNGDADAIVNLYITNEGITAYLDANIAIRGAQIEFGSVSNNPENMVINTELGQGYYLQVEELLRTLMYDRSGNDYIEAGENFLADMPFTITNPENISVQKLILVDINKQKVQKIEINIIYGNPVLPLDYILFQNYPNPFNPGTKVQFQVPKTSDVTIKIYDMLGQVVRTLFAGEVLRGTYSANWDGLSDTGIQMSSGSYIYRMTAGEFVQSKKMILLK